MGAEGGLADWLAVPVSAGLGGVAALLRGSRAECASAGGMTPVGQAPETADASAAQARAAAEQAREQGLPIGTAGQPSAADQLAAAAVAQQDAEKALGKRPNPGAFDRADEAAKRILNPEAMDGLKLVINKAASQQFQTTHEFVLGSSMIAQGGAPTNSYNFGVNLMPSEQVALLGRLDPSGNLTAQYIHNWSEPFTSRCVAHLSPDPARSALQCDLDFKGSDFTAGVKLSQGPYASVNYFQSVTKNFAMGGEGVFHAGQGYTHLFARGKYFDDQNELTLSVNTVNTLSAAYSRKVNERVNLAAEFEVNLNNRESLMNMGWEFNLRAARVTGTISTEGIIASQVAHMIDPACTVFFNGILDHSKDVHRFGYGLSFNY